MYNIFASLILAFLFLVSFPFCLNGQNIIRDGKEYSVVRSSKEKEPDVRTEFIWKDSDGVRYDIFITKKNSCYIWKTSKSSGKEYKKYLPKEVSADIAEQMGRSNEQKGNR